MLKILRTQIVLVLLSLIVTACASRNEFTLFEPKIGSLFNIEFSYPQSWEWVDLPVSNHKSFEIISVVNPYSENQNPANTSAVSISAIITNRSVDDTTLFMNRAIRELLIVTEKRANFHIVEDQIFKIDEHYTRKIARWSLTSEMDKPMIEEFIYILDEDRYYSIYIAVPEDEQNNQFHTEFKEMVESIKFLP